MTPAPADGSAALAEHLAPAVLGPLAPEDALDLVLRAIVEATHSRAGAICLFNAEQGLLRLGTEVGLSDAGCRQLRMIRRFAADSWEVPLDSLLDGRVHVLTVGDAAAELPALTANPEGVRALACIPVRGTDDVPLASLVLVVDDEHTVGEERLAELRPVVDRLAAIVATIGKRATTGDADTPRSLLESLADLALRGIEPAVREVFRLLERIPRPRNTAAAQEETRELERALDHEIRERRALEEQLTGERVQQREKLIEAETTWAQERMRARELERTVERLKADVEAARERDQQIRTEQLAAATRAAADRDEILRRAREVSQAAETARASAAADAEAARAGLAASEATVMGLRDEVRRAWAEADRLDGAAQAMRADAAKIDRTLQEARRREEEALERAVQAEQQCNLLAEEQRRLGNRHREREAEITASWTARATDADRLAADLRTQLTEAYRDRERLAGELVDATEQAQRLRAEAQAIMSRGAADRDATLAHAREMVQTAEHERAVAVAEAEAVRQALAQGQALILRMEDDQVASEQGEASREMEIRQSAERARAAENRRAAAAVELEQVRSELARARTSLLESEDQARRAQADIARLQELLTGARTEEERAATALGETRATCAAQTARLDELEREIAGLRERTAEDAEAARRRGVELEGSWRLKLEASETAWCREHLRRQELGRQHDILTADLSELREREARAREELETIQARSLADREETLRRALELTEGAEAARATAVAEAEAIRVTLTNSQSVILSAEDEARRTRLEGERITTELAALHSEHRDAVDALTQYRLDEARLQRRVAELEQETSTLRQQASRPAAAPAPATPPAPKKPAAPGATAGPVVLEPEDAGPGQRSVVVVDAAEQGWRSAGDDLDVTWMAPGPGLPAQIAERNPTRVVVNLAAPGALDAIEALRAAGIRHRLWGCLTTPGATRVLALGMVEVVGRPVDPDRILQVVQGYGTRGVKILAAGGDANVFISLRQALTREGMSVSIAWDTKQASDLVPMVRPGIVIVDLALPPRDGYSFVAQLTTLDPPPVTILVPRDGDPTPGFAAAIAERIGGESALLHHRLLARLFRKRSPR